MNVSKLVVVPVPLVGNHCHELLGLSCFTHLSTCVCMDALFSSSSKATLISCSAGRYHHCLRALGSSTSMGVWRDPREAASVCLQSLEARQDYGKDGDGEGCTVNWRGVNKGAGLLLLPSHARQQQQLTGKCYLENAESPTHPPPLHQTANLNAGAVTQVYKQQTVGPHQRLSLKDNRCGPPPHLPCLPTKSCFFHNTQTASPPLQSPAHCPLLSTAVVRGDGFMQDPVLLWQKHQVLHYVWNTSVNKCPNLNPVQLEWDQPTALVA